MNIEQHVEEEGENLLETHTESDNSVKKKDGLNQNFPSTSDCSSCSVTAQKIGDKELGEARELCERRLLCFKHKLVVCIYFLFNVMQRLR